MERIPEYYLMHGVPSEKDATGELSEVERLANEFAAHEEGERELLHQYRDIAAKCESPVVKLLLRLVVTDEEKHHAVTRAMVSTMKDDLLWVKRPNSLHETAEAPETRQELLKVTEDFIRLERQGIKDYKKLIDASKGYYHGLFEVLLKTMVRDSEKHIDILEFLRHRLKAA